MTGSERKLAAILAADLVGYSRHMAKDEEGTLQRLKGHLAELVRPKVVEHRGRIVKTTGDGLLAEFGSVFDAFACALDIQEGMEARNRHIPAGHRMQFRIGINIGDIIYDEEDIFGDGVNVAARLEGLAEPGGICVSARAWEDLRRLDVPFTDLGEQQLKNIAAPVRAYKVGGAGAGTAEPERKPVQPDPPPAARAQGGRFLLGVVAGVVGLIVLLVALAGSPDGAAPPEDKDQINANVSANATQPVPAEPAVPDRLPAPVVAPSEAPIRPSFDCRRAATHIERMICTSSELAALDVRLQQVYARAGRLLSSQADLRRTQREWMALMRDPCTDESCVAAAYRDRIRELEMLEPVE